MMWSAMNWLSQKAGINLDDAQEVLHRNDTSYIQADSDEGTESSKENQSVTGNGGGNLATANGKRMRRSGRWAPPASISSCGSGSSHLGSISHLYHNGVSSHSLSAGTAMHSNLSGSPLTPIVVPTGVSLGPYCMGSTAAHPPVAPVMVPTGLRTPGVAGVGYRGNSVGGMMTPTVGNVGSPSKLSPTSVQWKDVSMATDINSPRFSFRIVRQAEKETEFGSRIYPTAQEKYLATKHLPKVRLHGPSKPVMTPKKLNSVPLIQLPSSPKPPSSLAPMLSNAPHLPVSASTFFSPASAPITDFRHANFFSSSIRSSADSHPVLSGLLDGTGSSVDHHSNNTCRVLDLSPADVTSLSNSSSSMSNMAVMGAIYRSSTAFSVSQQAGDDSFLENDPTSLKAVLAALNKSRPGKGVKQARLVDCDDPESKRPCAEEAAALPDMSCTGSSSSYLVGGDGEKRALDMSSCSSLDNSQGSPCAKIPRTWPSDPIFKALVSDPSVPVNQPSNVQHQVTVGVGLGGSSLLPEPDDEGSETPSKRRKVNPWLASFSSSQKMAARERGVSLKQTTHSEVDLEALDTDPESSDRSSEDSDNSSCGEKEGDTKPNSSRSSPAPTASSDALMHKEQSDIVRIGTTPHIVTLAAHRSDKNMSHTRLNRMLGMLFHLSEDEVKSSTTKEATSVSSTFALASTSKDIVPVVSLTSSLVTSTETTAAAATQSLSSGAAYSSTGTSFSLTLPAPTSVVASSVTPSSSSTAASTAASYGLAHSATLPVASSSSDSSSSVSASFTFKLPAKAQSNEKTANDSSSSTVIDGVNPLISFLAKNVPSSTSSAESSLTASRDAQLSSSSAATNVSAASPAYTFSDKHLSGAPNPLLASFSANSSSEPKISEGFSLLAPSSTCTAASSNNAPQQSSMSVASSASAVPSMFSFGSSSGSSNASQLLFRGGNFATNSSTVNSSSAASSELTAPTTSVTASNSFFSFEAPSASPVISVPSVTGTTVATTSTGSSPAKPAGFQFGMGKASAGFDGFQSQNSSTSVPTGGFSFGKPAQLSDTTESTITFGTSASSGTSAAPPLFTFGCFAAAASTSAQAPGSATSAFTFGNSSFSMTSATTSTVSVTTTSASSDTNATFTFGPARSSNQQSNSSSTSASFTFTVKDKSNASLTGNSSPFTFGSSPSSTATSSSGSSSSDSLFVFGKSTTAASESTTTSTTTSKTSSTSVFSFGPPSTSTTSGSAFGTSVEAAGRGFGAGVTSTTASSAPQFRSAPNNVFGSMKSNTSSSSTDKSSATAGFGRFASASNLFANVQNNATSDAGESSSVGKSKTVTFGTSNTVSGRSNNLFGPTTPATRSNTTNLFGQATTTTTSNTSNLFGQATTTTISNTTNLFGQAATTTSSNTTNLFGQAASSTAAGLFNKAVATTLSFGSSTFGQPAASADKSAAPSSVAPRFQFGNSLNSSISNATFTFGSDKNNSTLGSTIQFGGASAAPASTFGAAANPAPSFGSISSNPVPSFGTSTSNTPSFGSGSSSATPSFGAVASNPPAFGATASNPTPTFGASGSSNPKPNFGSGTALPVPAFGSSTGSAPSFGSPAPSFGTPAANQSGMFQFSGAAATPQQQQQQPNALSAGHYVLGTSMGGGQEFHNVFSVGGSSSSSSTMRRPRVRAHRRNR